MDILENEECISRLDVLIDDIISRRSECLEEWSDDPRYFELNLRRIQVRDIQTDPRIMDVIIGYRRFLEKKNPNAMFRKHDIPEFEVKCRAKMLNSIAYKADRYMGLVHKGKVSINKCFNDILGVRAIISCRLTHEEICKHVNDRYGLKCIDSSKTDPESGAVTYRATHIYFSEGNTDFPWELQIWIQCNSESNYQSHKKYKQDYARWEMRTMGRIL